MDAHGFVSELTDLLAVNHNSGYHGAGSASSPTTVGCYSSPTLDNHSFHQDPASVRTGVSYNGSTYSNNTGINMNYNSHNEADLPLPSCYQESNNSMLSFTSQDSTSFLSDFQEHQSPSDSTKNPFSILPPSTDTKSTTKADKKEKKLKKPRSKPKCLVKRKQQRHEANVRERKRMETINDAFDSLKDRIPLACSDRRLSKVDTLRLAINYIHYLQDTVTEIDIEGFEMSEFMRMNTGSGDNCGSNGSNMNMMSNMGHSIGQGTMMSNMGHSTGQGMSMCDLLQTASLQANLPTASATLASYNQNHHMTATPYIAHHGMYY